MATMMLAYEHWEGTGPAVTLLHGFPVDRAMWRETVQALAVARREVLAPDLRGFGHSAVEAEATVDQMAADVVELWAELGIERSVVVGFSMGGYTALRLALEHAPRVAALCLVDTRAEADTAEAAAGREETAQHVLRDGMAPLAEKMLPSQLTAASREVGAPVVENLREMMLRQPRQGVAAALRGMATRPAVRERLGAIQVPTLVVVGAEDQVTPRSCAETLRDGIHDAELVEIGGAAHMVPMEQPEAWTKALLEWLASVDSAV